MRRIALTDESGRWFDPEKATEYEESTRWNGRNRISLATRSQWDHESLFQTVTGNWVLHAYSQWQGSSDTYSMITAASAAAWLIQNEYDELPVGLQGAAGEMEA